MRIPIIRVDIRKKEFTGLFANVGAVGANVSRRVNDHDFQSLTIAKTIAYGIYDLLFKHGFICLGDSSDTAEFAVKNLVQWWKNFGCIRSPNADRLVIPADCGGFNDNRSRVRKCFLQPPCPMPFNYRSPSSIIPPAHVNGIPLNTSSSV